MSQDSWCWECTGIGDGDARTVNDIINQNQLLGNLRPSESGVIHWIDTTALQGFTNASDGLLIPSNPAGDTVRIASGAAIVQGWLYANDADVDFDVSGGAANATDLIVLRRGDPASVSSVRLALVRGPAAGTATVTQTAATWEVAIAEVLLDGAGDFSALTDVREFAQSTSAWLQGRQGGSATVWDSPGTTDFLATAMEVQAGQGTIVMSGAQVSAELTVTFPRVFSNQPLVFVTMHMNSTLDVFTASIRLVSTTSFRVKAFDVTGASANNPNFNWWAVGPP